jgi:hypothetical protein
MDDDTDAFFSDPAWKRGVRELAQADHQSRRPQGDAHFHEGRLREAIEEYRKDTEVKITTFAQVSIVQRVFCHMGDAYLFLNQLEDAIAAYTRAVEEWRVYGCGQMPVASLAAAYLEAGSSDESIRACMEPPDELADPCVQHVLAEARRLKAGGEPSPESIRGCRRIHLPPLYVTGTPAELGRYPQEHGPSPSPQGPGD